MKKVWVLGILITASAAQNACKQPEPIKVVEGVCFEAFTPPGEITDDPWGRVTIKWLPVGGVSFGNGIVPIIWRDHGVYGTYGYVRTAYNPVRQATDMFVELNIAKASQRQGEPNASKLPNGNTIPMGAEGNENLWKLTLNNPNGEHKDFIYFSASESSLFLGVSYQIRNFDKTFKDVPVPLNLFLPIINVETGREIVSAGVYTSPNAGKNGVGVFMDASDLLNAIEENTHICHGEGAN